MIKITNEPIPVEAVIASTHDESAGGHVHFVGTIRREHDLNAIEYQCYLPLAKKQMEAVVAEARENWPLKKVSVVHRVGPVPVGEAAVVIAVSGAHRKEAFRACEFIIDRIKQIVPIWKEGGEKCCHH